MAGQSEMHPITNKKRYRSKKSNDKEQQSHSKSYKKLKNEIKEVRKDLSTLTSIVFRMDDTIRKQTLELSKMKQMLERLVQNREDMITSDQPYVEEQHTEEQHTKHQEETQWEHQEESGSDISIDDRDADSLLTIRDILDNLNPQTDNQKAEWTDATTHLNLWTKEDLEYYFNTVVGDFQDKPGWGDVNYVIGCINIKEHWLAIAVDMRKCKIYVFNSMPNYLE
ncbi:Ulp1-like peptidase [Cucumis melo var. makuwa]|uniref:Ulp1-like peptidase n=1 Tax=Cucumis melo var. makuwa TaxID=1194695 RepID=A0A5A7TVP6_CUCMM|nr:Ulp1-like peptidase [Cucumis melo var. makuwa]TYK28805.1 Ulp1-like peptidase [Cucumis melo var. makuwa]